MNKKVIIIIISIFVIMITLVLLKQNKKNTNSNFDIETSKKATLLDNDEIDSDGYYVIVDENGEEITRVQDEYMVQKYLDNPDYHPGPMYGVPENIESKDYSIE